MLKRLNGRSAKYQVLKQVFSAHRNTLYFPINDEHFFFLENVLNIHIQLQEIESILKVLWNFNHRNKFTTRLQSYIIFVIFLDVNLKAMG